MVQQGREIGHAAEEEVLPQQSRDQAPRIALQPGAHCPTAKPTTETGIRQRM